MEERDEKKLKKYLHFLQTYDILEKL